MESTTTGKWKDIVEIVALFALVASLPATRSSRPCSCRVGRTTSSRRPWVRLIERPVFEAEVDRILADPTITGWD